MTEPRWERLGARLYHGDCRAVLASLGSGLAKCCVTSPPYWGLRNYQIEPAAWGDWLGCLGLEPTPDLYVAHIVEVFRVVRDALEPDGTLWLNMGDCYATKPIGAGSTFDPKWPRARDRSEGFRANRTNRPADFGLKHKDRLLMPARVALALQADGWWLRDEIVWHKPNVMPNSQKDRTTAAHEFIYMFSKSAKYFYDQDAIDEPVTGKSHARGTGINPKAEKNASGSRQNSGFSAAVRGLVKTRTKRSVWSVPTAPYKGAHFATFPAALITPCVLAGCPEGGTVLDPFNGSGTTGDVAVSHGRLYVGIDANASYLDLAITRISAAQDKNPLWGAA